MREELRRYFGREDRELWAFADAVTDIARDVFAAEDDRYTVRPVYEKEVVRFLEEYGRAERKLVITENPFLVAAEILKIPRSSLGPESKYWERYRKWLIGRPAQLLLKAVQAKRERRQLRIFMLVFFIWINAGLYVGRHYLAEFGEVALFFAFVLYAIVSLVGCLSVLGIVHAHRSGSTNGNKRGTE